MNSSMKFILFFFISVSYIVNFSVINSNALPISDNDKKFPIVDVIGTITGKW
jgi:hypothetical protein